MIVCCITPSGDYLLRGSGIGGLDTSYNEGI